MTQSKIQALGVKINDAIGTDIDSWSVDNFELCLVVDHTAITRVLSYLRDTKGLEFTQLMDVCGVDKLGEQPRFQVVYNLLSVTQNVRIRIKVLVDEGIAVPSSVSVFSSAGWWEREVFDLYGIPFSDHPDLRRILTDYNFEGHPLRKDFPLTGYVEVRYDEEQKKVIYEPVDLPLAFRNFDFESPWEEMSRVAATYMKSDQDEDQAKEVC